MTPSLRSALVAFLAAGVLSGCGGYARDEPPTPYTEATPGVPAETVTSGQQAPTGTASAPAPTVIDPTVIDPTASATGPAEDPAPVTCTRKGGVNALSIAVPGALRDGLGSIRVQLLQGGQSRQVVFPVSPASGRSTVARGVVVTREGYLVRLGGDGEQAALNATWVPNARATLIVEGRTDTDAVEYRRTQTFAFRLTYPNGKQCDKTPNFSFSTALRAMDRVGLG